MPVDIPYAHTHTQTIPQQVWQVTHKRGTLAPVVDCFIDVDGVSTKILPYDLRVITANTIEIEWTTPRTGTARIV